MKCNFSFSIYIIFICLRICCGQNIKANSSPTRNYNGLLSDFLQAFNHHKLNITSQCSDQLKEIQRGLNEKDVYAIKCKYL